MPRHASEPGLRERKAAATRQALFDAAIRLFTAHGFEAPTVDDIAAAAEVGKGTFYNYFASKEEILVVHMIAAEAELGRRIAKLADGKGPLEAILLNVIRAQLRIKKPRFAFHRIFLATLVRGGPELLPHLIRMQACVDPPLTALFERVKARGLVRADADVAAAVFAFKCLQTGVFTIWSMTGPDEDAAVMAATAQVGPFAAFLKGGP